MKLWFTTLSVLLVFTACNNQDENGYVVSNNEPMEKQSFFPVTSYLKGQIFEIKKAGINPLKYTTQNNKTDSVWLKIEELESALAEFIHPEIDTTNVIHLFTEKRFLDETIAAYTFSYDPISSLPDTMQLRRWDVYVDPETGKVKRIYIVKNINPTTILQLTWLSDKWCKITKIESNSNGVSIVKSEVKITWDF